MSLREVNSFCRVCLNYCPIVAEVKDGRVTAIRGDRSNATWNGHTCIKGRQQHRRLHHPERILRSLKRRSDGTLGPIDIELAMDEIAARLARLSDTYGSHVIAGYLGMYFLASPLNGALFGSFMRAIGSDRMFTPTTIDKPGRPIARTLLGDWMAPPTSFDAPEVALMIGTNPLVTYAGVPFGNPGWLRERMQEGMKLIVIDPRKTETAKRADVFLQPRPGRDPLLLGAILHVMLAEELYDREFVAENVVGVESLRRAVEPLTPDVVAARADVDATDLAEAARVFGRSRRGYAVCGTGPSMAGRGVLTEYLAVVLDTLAGHWLRAGEPVPTAPALLPPRTYKAQACPPEPAGFDISMGVRNLGTTAAGLPTAALPDNVLSNMDDRIRALISSAGNPVAAWPNQRKTVAALRSLDMLVQIDPWMSQTAKLADYVIAPKMSLETAATTQLLDVISGHFAGYGLAESHAQYTPAVVDTPPGADLIEEWEFFYGLAQRLDLPLEVVPGIGFLSAPEDGLQRGFCLDMQRKPSTEELLALLASDSRITLDEVALHPHGQVFPASTAVAPKDPGWPHRLDVANDEMMLDLYAHVATDGADDETFPFRLICRRTRGMFNSAWNDGITRDGARHNLAHVHPDDLAKLGIVENELIALIARHGTIVARVTPDATLRRGLVAMAHGFGGIVPSSDEETYMRFGSSVSALLSDDENCDRWSGQPLMSNVPVALARVADFCTAVPTTGNSGESSEASAR